SSQRSRRSSQAQARSTGLAVGTILRWRRSALSSMLLPPLPPKFRNEIARPPSENARRASRRYGVGGPLSLTARSRESVLSLGWTFLGEEAQELPLRALSRGSPGGSRVLFG